MKIQTIHKLKLPFDKKVRGLNWLCNRITENAENYLIRKCDIFESIQTNTHKEKLILSMTTYPAREGVVGLTIKSLLNQNTPVDRFVIWLAEEQYPDKKIPDVFQEFLSYGVEIKFCDDLRSHKKYYYTMQENPNDLVITVDDDVIYPENTIEKLLRGHEKYPDTVICNQARWVELKDNKFAPYSDWKTYLPKQIKYPNFAILPIGCGGVLYPPKSLSELVFDKELIHLLAPYGDDLWLKFMEIYNGTRAMVSCDHQRGLSDVKTKGVLQRLSNHNVNGGMNDKAITMLSDYFPEIKDKIKNDIQIVNYM